MFIRNSKDTASIAVFVHNLLESSSSIKADLDYHH